MSSNVQGLKRGHHHEFALTEDEIEALIGHTKSPESKAILILASRGLRVQEITQWNARSDHPLLHGIRQDYWLLLMQFPNGLGISEVAIWRRVRKALLQAGKHAIISIDKEHLPYPEALRYRRKPPEASHLRDRLTFLAKRLHVLNGGVKDLRDPLSNCPHLDCMEVRDLIGMLEHFPDLLKKEVIYDSRSKVSIRTAAPQ